MHLKIIKKCLIYWLPAFLFLCTNIQTVVYAGNSETIRKNTKLYVKVLSNDLKPLNDVLVSLTCEGFDSNAISKMTDESGFVIYDISSSTACSISCYLNGHQKARVIVDIEKQEYFHIEMVLTQFSYEEYLKATKTKK